MEDRSPTHLSPKTIERVKERWEREVLRVLERQERRIEHARNERTPLEALTPLRSRDLAARRALPARTEASRRRPLGPLGIFFLRTNQARRAARLGGRWLGGLVRPGLRLAALSRDPERAARRMTFRLATTLAPRGIREALWMLRGLQGLGLRSR